MPLYTYACRKCDAIIEALVFGAEKARCPACGSLRLEWQPGAPAPQPQSKRIVQAARAQASREGHTSNYSAGTRQRLKRGKSEA